MNLKDILAISGEGTLFKFIAQGKNAVIVENLETGRRFSAGGTARVSALDEISIYTTGEDIPLGKVMDLIWEKENGGGAISHRQPDPELKKYFSEVLPDYDPDRVYTSDIRKVLHWYNILQKLGLLVREEEKTGEAEPETTGAGKDSVTGSDAGAGKDGVAGNDAGTAKDAVGDEADAEGKEGESDGDASEVKQAGDEPADKAAGDTAARGSKAKSTGKK